MNHPMPSNDSPLGAPRENRLIAQFPPTEFARIEPVLKPIYLRIGDVLYESGAPLEFAYFPTTAIVSMVHVLMDGASAEIAIVGNDGVVGVALFLGGNTMPRRAVVKSAGWAYRVPRAVIQRQFALGGSLQMLILRFTQAAMTQIAQTAACNRHHSIAQQLCRLLLLSLDRIDSSQLAMTQESIANMLGVRREGVTEAAGRLQSCGLIQYSRGHIMVLDRNGLEAQACECYGVIARESERLLSATPATIRVRAPWPALVHRARVVDEGLSAHC